MKQSIPEALAQVARIRGFAWATETAPTNGGSGVPVLADDGTAIGALESVSKAIDEFELLQVVAPLDIEQRTRLLQEQLRVERELVEHYSGVAPAEEIHAVLRRSAVVDDDVDLEELASPAALSDWIESRHAQALVARAIAERVQPSTDDPKLAKLATRLAEVREQVFVDSIRLAASFAKQHRGGLPWARAFADACAGLVEALDRYDPEKGFQFSTYAQWWIRHRLGRARADHSRSIRLPVHAEEGLTRFVRAERELSRERGERPASSDVIARANLASDMPRRVGEWRRPVVRIPIASESGLATTVDSIMDPMLPSPSEGGLSAGWIPRSEATLRAWIAHASSKDETRSDILALRLAIGIPEGETLSTIGIRKGVSRERIRQLQSAALDRITALASAMHVASSLEPWDWPDLRG